MSTPVHAARAGTERVPVASDQLIYLYAIIDAGGEANQLLSRGVIPGMEPAAPLFPIEHGRLVAAVSRVPAATFQEEPLNALLASLSRLAPYALRHEEAIRALLPAASALLPAAFGAVYRDEDRVTALLDERAEELRRLLDELRGRQEWGLKLFGQTERLQSAATAASADLRQLDAELATTGPGRAYLLGKRRERLLVDAVARLANEAVARILARLEAQCVALRIEEPAPRQPAAAELLLKAAFLVEAGQVPDFRASVAELQQEHAALGMSLELTGPWAPYSFVGGRDGAA